MKEELLRHVASLVDYNPETGSMVWRKRESGADAARWNARYAGKQAGAIDDRGYRRIMVRSMDGKPRRVRAHQVAWFIFSGRPQAGEIDHVNQDKLDNSASNLRDVSKSLNQRNRVISANNSSGVTGVCWHKQRKKWCAQSTVDGHHKHIGLFESIKDADEAVKKFRAENGFTETHGRAAAAIGSAM